MIVLDTTVLVYATGSEHPFREPSRRLVAAIADGGIEAATTVEVVQEYTQVRARRLGRYEAVRAASAFIDLLSPLLVVADDHLREGLRIYEQTATLGTFDAVLAARARSAAATSLVSADKAFSQVSGLRHVVPDDAGVHRLLG